MDKSTLAANEILNSVKEKLGDGYEAQLHYVTKPNKNQAQTGLIIKKGDANIFPTIYIDGEIQKYLLNLSPLEAITDGIIKEYFQCDNIGDFDLSPFGDFDWVKGKLICQLVNTSLNENLLSEIPSIPFMDLSIAFRVLLDPPPSEGVPSILVTNRHLKLWGINRETIYKIAKENTPILLPVKIIKLSELVRNVMLENNMAPKEPERLDIPDVNMYVLTNQKFWLGSYCINYPGILSSLAEEENANLYILPSSIYETIIVPDSNNISLKELQDIVYHVNKNSIPKEELLSYSVYYFSRKTQKITQL